MYFSFVAYNFDANMKIFFRNENKKHAFVTKN